MSEYFLVRLNMCCKYSLPRPISFIRAKESTFTTIAGWLNYGDFESADTRELTIRVQFFEVLFYILKPEERLRSQYQGTCLPKQRVCDLLSLVQI